MAITNGKLEGRITVPTGGWTGTVNDSGAGGAATWTIAAGTYYHSSIDGNGGGTESFATAWSTALNTAATTDTLTVAIAATENGTGKYTLTSTGATTITFDSTTMRDLVGFATNMASGTTWTGDYQARQLWLPNCPYYAMNAISTNFRGRRDADQRTTENMAGYRWSFSGQERVVLPVLAWNAAKQAKTWIANESTTNESMERFVRDALWGLYVGGTSGGPVRFYPNAGTDTTFATYAVMLPRYAPEMVVDGWAGGPWRIRLEELFSVPGTEDEG